MKNHSIVNINTNLKEMMRHWLKFTQPFHKLTKQQQSILSLFLYHYFEYKKTIKNEDIVWKLVFDYDTKLKIKEELNNLPDYTLQNILTTLRKKNIVKNNKITKAYIPNLEVNNNKFTLIYKFNIKDE